MKKISIIFLFIILVTSVVTYFLCFNYNQKTDHKKMIDLSSLNEKEIRKYAEDNNLKIEIKYENNELEEGLLISQSIKKNTVLEAGAHLEIIISLGEDLKKLYLKYQVDELGYIPVMMYHGVHNLKNEETDYYSGNVDKDGYNRTTEAFRNDLEMYYQKGYRMIRLIDYVNYKIDTEIGYSPLVLTFDDGNINNFKVEGLDESNNLIIDPNSAIGILEEFKKKYPDFKVTATFFLNEGLFKQSLYNEQILNWLIDNGYDIGNHTTGHVNFTKIDEEETQKSIATLYQQLDKYIPNKYVKIVSLPFGSPYKKTHPNFKYILNGSYNGYQYKTISTLKVGWTYNPSPFHIDFDNQFLMRIRAWDTDSDEIDITKAFIELEEKRYISDGNFNTIVTKEEKKDIINNNNDKEVILY